MDDQPGKIKQPDEKFCYECGEIIKAKAEICPRCGVRQPYIRSHHQGEPGNFLAQGEPRNRIVAGLLALIGGGLGLHKFYLGKPGWGVVYILLLCTGISVILGIIEGINYLIITDQQFEARYGGPGWLKG